MTSTEQLDIVSGKRKHSALRNKYKREIEAIWDWRPPKCCRKWCSLQLGVERCRFLRRDFLSSSQMKRKEKLLEFRFDVGDDSAYSIQIDGVRVCTRFLREVLNVSSTLRSSVLGLPSATSSHLPGRIGGHSTSETKQIGIISFLNDLVEQLGDSMPHSTERHLPHKSKKLVYLLYYDKEVKNGRKPGMPTLFYSTWKLFAPHIKCMRSHTFETCDTCITFRDNQRLMLSGKLIGKTKANVISSFNRHLHDIKSQRAEYRRVRQMASEQPGDIISVIIDGADQAKFGLPRFVDTSKNEKGYALKQKVTGVLFHYGLGTSDFFCVFTARENIPGGANQTIDVLFRGLLALWKRRALRDSFRTYAKELFVQLDNTAKDNKNRFFFAFCDHLIHLGIFKKITVNFLPVGHTHEDIDRKFSRISVNLKQKNTVTVSELHECIRTSERWAVQPLVVRAKGHLNYSSCLRIQSCVVRDMPGISTFQKFRFERCEEKTTRNGQRYSVVCKTGYSMITPDHEMKALPIGSESVGCFLTKYPDMSKIPDTVLQTISVEEADKYRARLRSTERRIRSQEKTEILRREIDDLQFIPQTSAEWNYSELEDMQCAAEKIETCDDISEEELPDGLSYEVGEMVTVRASAESLSATPFWLGCIQGVKTFAQTSCRLVVRWYQLKIEGRKTRSGSDFCFKGQYMPCDEKSSASYDEIPSESVLCAFENLSRNGCIPLRAQQHTRQALADFTETNDPFSHAGEERRYSGDDEEGSCNGSEQEDDMIEELLPDVNVSGTEERMCKRSRSSTYNTDGLTCDAMITVRCCEQERMPFWLGRIVSFLSGSPYRMKVRWYKPLGQVNSDEEYYNSCFAPDPVSAITSIASSAVITSFKLLTKKGKIPRKAQEETKKKA